MNGWRETSAIDLETDEEFARAVGIILPEWEIDMPRDLMGALDADDLLLQADFWSNLHRAG